MKPGLRNWTSSYQLQKTRLPKSPNDNKFNPDYYIDICQHIYYIIFMKLQLSKIDPKSLQTPTNFAKQKDVDRKYIYELIKKDVIDFVEIDGVIFIHLNQRAKDYTKTRYL